MLWLGYQILKVMLGAARNSRISYIYIYKYIYIGKKIIFSHERMEKLIFLCQSGQPFFFYPLPPPSLRFFQQVCCYPSHKTSKVTFKERKQQKINR